MIHQKFSRLKFLEENVNKKLDEARELQSIIDDENAKWNKNEMPDSELVKTKMEEIKPIIEEYRVLMTELNDLKLEICELADIKEHELKDFYDFYTFSVKLDKVREIDPVTN